VAARQRIALLLFLLLATGCAGSSRYMEKDKTPDPIAAPAGKALIVFVRPSGVGYAVTFTVFDDKGNFVGQVPAKGHVMHVADPGHHNFIVWAENTTLCDVTVSAGKIYIIEVATRTGMWAARSHLLPVKRGGDKWDKAMEWVKKTNEWDTNPELAKEWKTDKKEGLEKQFKRAKEVWAKYNDKEREERTMRPDDGR